MKARRILGGLAAILLLVLGAGFAWGWANKPMLDLGVGYGARVACGCRYMGNRSLADCKKDFEPGMEQIQLSEDSKTQTVTASVPLIASRSVRHDPILGCVAETFSGTPYQVKPR
jgi:hypothetical protein